MQCNAALNKATLSLVYKHSDIGVKLISQQHVYVKGFAGDYIRGIEMFRSSRILKEK